MKTLLLSAIAGLFFSASSQTSYFTVGDTAGDFRLMDTDSQYYQLSDYRNQVVAIFTMGYF